MMVLFWLLMGDPVMGYWSLVACFGGLRKWCLV